MRKKWEYYKDINTKNIEELQEKYEINKLLATILSNRGIDVKTAEKFLEPTRYDFYDPFLMPDMEKAVNRIINAIKTKEKTIIYGDYDVDGITSITVLKSFLEDRGLEVESYIPNRLEEGYGLNKKAIEKIAKENFTLMITVDCGITAIEEVEYAKSLGIETIVTDHHEPIEELPNAIAVVDCKRKDNEYPFRELAGVGVAFKFTQAISIMLQLESKDFLKYLDIVAIGTISDIVPLVDENRIITKLGLKLVNCTKNKGLQALLKEIGYKQIDSTAIAFGVAPRINACGRMGSAKEGLNLLLAKNEEEAEDLAISINEYNNLRQAKEKKIYDDAIKQIEENNLENSNGIVLGGEDWHSGVIGIVSSKITDMFFKPSILVCFEKNSEIGKGSRKKHTRV